MFKLKQKIYPNTFLHNIINRENNFFYKNLLGKNNKYSKGVGVYLFIFLGAALIAFFWGFALYKLFEFKNKNFLLYGEINETKQKIKDAKNIEIAYEELKNKMDAIDEIILNKDEFVKLIESLEYLADASNVKLKLKSAQMPQDSEAPILGLEATGDFSGIFLFLKMIESSPYLSSFSRVVIQKNSEDINQNNVGQGIKNEETYKWMLDANLKILSYKNKE